MTEAAVGAGDMAQQVADRQGGASLASLAASQQSLRELFLANADRGDHEANDELVADLVARTRMPGSALVPSRRGAAAADPWRSERPTVRAVAAGRLSDGSACTIVLQLEQGRWVLYPHGAGRLAVEVPVDELAALVEVVRAAPAAVPTVATAPSPADAQHTAGS